MTRAVTAAISSYRLFVTNARGRIDSVAREVLATSDEDALARAVEMVGRVAFELWIGNRRIATPGHGERGPDRSEDRGRVVVDRRIVPGTSP